MSDLVVLVGPPASGKAAIGEALGRLTGFRFLHNHMTAEAVAALFGWGTPAYLEALVELRLGLLRRALAQPDMPSIVFTFVWAFELEEDARLVAQLVDLFESSGREVFFVELLATEEARIAREGTPVRLRLKPAKNDVEAARAFHAEANAKHRMNSHGDFPYPARHLVIDTASQDVEGSARLIARHFGFTTVC